MTEKHIKIIKNTDFKDLMPKIELINQKQNPIYIKAYLDRNEKRDGDYSRNTTVWD